MAETTTTSTTGGWRMPLALRIFLLLALLLGAAVLATVLITQRKGQQVADEAISRMLGGSVDVQREFAQRRLEGLQLKIQVIAGDTAFVNYVSESLGGGLGLGGDESVDQGSVADQLKERQQNVGFDLGILLDPKSKIVTRTDETEAFDKSMEGDPFVEAAQKTLQPLSGFWRQGGKLYQAAIMPLQQDTRLVGFLMLADAVNDDLGKRVAKVSGADIAYVLPGERGVLIAGSSLDPALGEKLAQAIDAPGALGEAVKNGTEIARAPLDFAGQRWVATVMPLDKDAGPLVGTSLAMTSADKITAGYREILNQVTLAGGLFLLVALPASFVLAKITLRPVQVMARAAREAAAGNYQTTIGIRGEDELAQLSHSFDSLLSDLRERKDIEGYVSNLSRFLPDPGQAEDVPSFVTQRMGDGGALPSGASHAAGSTYVAPQRESLLLLGLDLREAARPLADEAPEALLARISQHATQIVGVAARARGKAVALSGARLVIGFSGEDKLKDALGVCRAAMEADPVLAAAALEGEIVHGSVNAGGDTVRTTAGVTGYQLERLIAESQAGKLLLPRNLGEACKGLLGDAAVAVIQGAVSGKSFYAVARDFLPEPQLSEASAPPTEYVTMPGAATPAGRITRGTELKPGMRFGGRYDILSVLGEGGMGVVYKARDIELDDVVALKMLKPAALVDSEQLERLKSEIKLARKITHPNVLRTFDFGEAMGLPYISMEYVRGMTLRYLLRQAGRIPYSAALRIARQLAAGLAAAHAVGVLHRDIKPENLILEANGNAKLMDFGIARPIQRATAGHTQPGMFVGTPHYSAPEQLTGDEVDHRADIYSSGVLLCEMFSGKLPFNGSNTMEIYMAQMSSEPIKPSTYWPEIPPALEAIILRAIERKADARYQSAAELGDALATLRA